MPLSPYSTEEKPYNICLNCIHIGKNCDGPNFLAMTPDRWSEWMRLRKEYLGWTNAKIAELAGVSKVSIDRALSGNTKDIRVTTMQAITKALVNGSWGKYPCAMSAVEKETVYVDNPETVKECEHLAKQLETAEKRIEELNRQLEMRDNLMKERYDFLKRKDMTIGILIVICIFLFVIVMATAWMR